MTLPRVVALAQQSAGDDGVGAAIARALRTDASIPLPCVLLSDPAQLLDLLDGSPIILIDAVLGDPPGQILVLTPDQVAEHPPARVSSHGLGLIETLALARVLAPLPPLHIVAITVARPTRWQDHLSPAVAAAIPRAVERVREIGRLFAVHSDHPRPG